MRWIAAARERLAALFYRGRQDAELDEELEFHVEQEAGLLRDAGLDPNEAWREARRRLGGIQQCKEDVRAARGLGAVDDLTRDVAIASGASRAGRSSLGVAVTLGLGIGATTTIYAVVDSVMLRRLPYHEPAALVTVGAVSSVGAFVAPGVQDLGPIYLHYQQLRARARSFELLAAVNVERFMPLPTPDGGEKMVPAHEALQRPPRYVGDDISGLGPSLSPRGVRHSTRGSCHGQLRGVAGAHGGDPGSSG